MNGNNAIDDGVTYDAAPTKRKPIICVDFDGVLHLDLLGWRDGSLYGPVTPGARKFMQQLATNGWHIIIHTVRATDREQFGQFEPGQAEIIADWLRKNGIPFHEIHILAGKPFADVYLDDRAVRFDGNWAKVTEQLRDYKPWAERLDRSVVQQLSGQTEAPVRKHDPVAASCRALESVIMAGGDFSPEKIARWVNEFQRQLAQALNVPSERVEVSAMTQQLRTGTVVTCSARVKETV